MNVPTRREDVLVRATTRGRVVWPLDHQEPMLLSSMPSLVWEHLGDGADVHTVVDRVGHVVDGDQEIVRRAVLQAIQLLAAHGLLRDSAPS